MSTPEQPYNRSGSWKKRPLSPRGRDILAKCATMRARNVDARKNLPPPEEGGPDFDSYDRRLGEIEQRLLLGTPEGEQQAAELHESLWLDMEADSAAMMSMLQERLVRFSDMVAVRMEEKKFEMSTEARDGLEEVLEPYKDKFREEMLKSLPIETRRQLEAEKKRLEQEGTGLD